MGRTKTGVAGHIEKRTVSISRTLAAEYYAQRDAEAKARREQSPDAGHRRRRAGDSRRNEIAELIRQNLTRAEIMRRLKCSCTLVEDVRADMFLGKHGGFP